jgi:hypothetical protein
LLPANKISVTLFDPAILDSDFRFLPVQITEQTAQKRESTGIKMRQVLIPDTVLG